MCWVQEGIVEITVAGYRYKLEQGMALQFDALLDHEYNVLEDCKLIITHLKKNVNFFRKKSCRFDRHVLK